MVETCKDIIGQWAVWMSQLLRLQHACVDGVILDGRWKGENCPAKEGLMPWVGVTLAGKRDWIVGGTLDRRSGLEDVWGPSTKTAEAVAWCPCDITGVWPCHPKKNVARWVAGLRAGCIEIVDWWNGTQIIVCKQMTEQLPTTMGMCEWGRTQTGLTGCWVPTTGTWTGT